MVPENLSNELSRLVATWHERYPRRALGGTWALRGFSFQAAVFLLEFYQRLIDGRDLPRIEVLSDILCPSNSEAVIVIQVKRRLTQASLGDTLREFDLIRDLCAIATPALLPHLRLQIACRERDASLTIPSHVPCLATDEFIKLAPDPIEDLYALLWLHGLVDPQNIIQNAAGRLLMSFDNPAAAPSTHHDLVSIYETARRRFEGARTGHLVLPEDVRPEEPAIDRQRIVIGSGFGFREVREGYFRSRPKIFARLRNEFQAWLNENHRLADERRLPVFWIDGRSGEGKSVLLRQLIADIVLNGADRLPIIEVNREDVPRALEEHRDSSCRPVLLMIDDLYAVHDRELWSEEFQRYLESEVPQTWLVTCGPTEQREEFENRFTCPIAVRCFTVPIFAVEELGEFVDWFTNRTGRTVQLDALTRENTLLVQAMFEMAEGTSLQEFARRFRRRLVGCGLEPAVRRILAINALYIAAPLVALANELPMDGLSRLAADDQRHFAISGSSVSFAHAHLAGEILKPILQTSFPHLNWEVSWARELSVFLDQANALDSVPRSVIAALMTSPRLDEGARQRSLVELYRLSMHTSGGVASHAVMPRWLEVLHRMPHIALEPSPLDVAIEQLRGASTTSDRPHPSVARWIWLLTDRLPLLRSELEELCWKFLTTGEQTAAASAMIGFALAQTTDRNLRHNRILKLLADGSVGHTILQPALASFPEDPLIRQAAKEWFHLNRDRPQSLELLKTMITNDPDDSVWKLAAQWFKENQGHRQASEILRRLISRSPSHELGEWLSLGFEYVKIPEVLGKDGILGVLLSRTEGSRQSIDLAIDFALDANQRKEQRDSVLFHLARISSQHPRNTLAYLAVCEENSRKREVSRAMATGTKRYPKRLPAVLDALRTKDSQTVFGVLGQMVRLGITDASVIDFALEAVTLHHAKPGYGSFLQNLARQSVVWSHICSRNGSLLSDLDNFKNAGISRKGRAT